MVTYTYDELHKETIINNPLLNVTELHKITNIKLQDQTKRYERYIKIRNGK